MSLKDRIEFKRTSIERPAGTYEAGMDLLTINETHFLITVSATYEGIYRQYQYCLLPSIYKDEETFGLEAEAENLLASLIQKEINKREANNNSNIRE